jgi:hypothetical protein
MVIRVNACPKLDVRSKAIPDAISTFLPEVGKEATALSVGTRLPMSRSSA